MHWTGWIVVALALFLAGWFVYDGMHAVLTGDYVTPRSGRFAGQLGPWSTVVEAVGIPARSGLMRGIFIGYGAAWIAITIAFLLGARWAWAAMVVAAAGALWYLPFGTLIAVIELVLLLLPGLRRAAEAAG